MDYSSRITESVAELTQLEGHQKLARDRDRVRFLRLLKEKTASSQRQAGETINLAQRQSQRLWQRYTQQGIAGLIGQTYSPAFGKLSASQISQLQAWLRLDEAATADRPDISAYPSLHPATMGHQVFSQWHQQTL